MFKFSALFFAMALSQASAIRSGRELSEEKFISYEPQTTVTDHVRYPSLCWCTFQFSILSYSVETTNNGVSNSLISFLFSGRH